MALATGSGAAEKPEASALPLTRKPVQRERGRESFRVTTNHMEDALSENDSRPLPEAGCFHDSLRCRSAS
jgi:hypothetical protein